MDDTEHPNEAISAVVDDSFIGEEDEDDDYEDLYNDVNVGENFLQSLNPPDDVAVPEPEKDDLKNELKIDKNEPKIDNNDAITNSEIVPDRVVEEEKKEVETHPVEGNFSNQALASNNNIIINNNSNNSFRPAVNGSGGGGMLFVGDLQWWTTDAELEAELCKYGAVKEVRFFDEKASGKSKGYAQVEFFDQASASACKDGMNGFVFNGRACVVAFASPFSIRRMGEAQANRGTIGPVSAGLGPVKRDGFLGGNNNASNSKPIGNNVAPVGSYQDNNNSNNNNNIGFGNRGGFGRGNWGRGNGMGSRGGAIRNRPMMGRGGMMGNNNNGFGTGPMLPMMGQSFDPTFRMGGYGGFPGGPTPPFNGMMSSFPGVGGVGMPGVAPHVNPAFFGRGMGMNGMGIMSSSGVEGANLGMWNDPNLAGWGGEEHVEEAVSDHQFGEVSRERRTNATKEKDRGGEREYRDDREGEYERETPREKEAGHDQEWQERRPHRDERERERSRDRGRDRHRDERERYVDHHHRYKDREPEYDDEWERGRSSRGHNKSRLSQEEGQHFRSREGDYSKRRRLTSE